MPRHAQQPILVNKRTPLRPATQATDLYVSRGQPARSIVPVVNRGVKLLVEDQFESITVHGLGAAIPVALRTALTIQAKLHHQATLCPTTTTVTLFDDCHQDQRQQQRRSSSTATAPTASVDSAFNTTTESHNDDEFVTCTRNNSAIHIVISLTQAARAKLTA
ncbi:hypothetical protein H4R34_003610 [Dimargaris verticillata]|uniref:Uncharacterized protein n=1 Tax=Dimargaris verticillata TaxID=2761393 RepID=A0A9W8B0D2_9FUNG|nr:hypothetical protein H4R34_003610 [Dimargaris verticillata]